MVVRVFSSAYLFSQIMQIYTAHTPTWYLHIIWYWTFVDGKMSVLKYMDNPSPTVIVNKQHKVQGSATKVSHWWKKYKTYMRQLLFSHCHSSKYVGISYSVFGITCHWWVIPYTTIHTNMIIHMIKSLWAIITINVLWDIPPKSVSTWLYPWDTPTVTARDCIPHITPITAWSRAHVFSFTSNTLLWDGYHWFGGFSPAHKWPPCIIRDPLDMVKVQVEEAYTRRMTGAGIIYKER